MQTTWRISATVFFFFIFFTGSSWSENSKIFRIECHTGAGNHYSTGFYVKEMTGIVAALHGVADCDNIKASLSYKQQYNMKIKKVDILRDAALLSSDDFLKDFKSKEGLRFSSELPDKSQEVTVDGFPLNFDSLLESRELRIRKRAIRLLDSLIPRTASELIENWKERNSPSLGINVLSIEGHLLPGYSGAPILNKANEVVGIANGGLQGGKVEISWAIPCLDINWEDASKVEEEIKRLKGLSRLNLFGIFVMNNGETLQWQRKVRYMAWGEHADYVDRENSSDSGGYNNWRIPKVGELKALAKFVKANPGAYSDEDSLYWSCESRGGITGYAVDFKTGMKKPRRKKDTDVAVRLVRNAVQ